MSRIRKKNLSVNQALQNADLNIRRGEFSDAEETLNKILSLEPNNFIAKKKLKALRAAEIQNGPIKKHETQYLNNLKSLYHERNYELVIENCRKALIGNEDRSATLWNILGAALQATGKHRDAISVFEKALKIHESVEVYCNIATAYKNLGKLDRAVELFNKAVQVDANYAGAYYGLALCLKVNKQLDEAATALETALKLNPDFALAKIVLYEIWQQTCDFSKLDAFRDEIVSFGVTKLGALPTLQALSWEDNPKEQQTRSVNRARNNFSDFSNQFPSLSNINNRKIKVGYFSADFHSHATLYLMMGLFREHDTDKFEVHVYNYDHKKSDEYTNILKNTVENCHEVGRFSDVEIVKLARTHQLDIAIDVKGYTQFSRMQIFQFGLAPIQVSYLAYPGTSGAPFFQYLVADPVLIDQNTRDFYTENIIFMPHSYQPNDCLREISSNISSRKDHMLPDNAFVYCCFNNNAKITQAELTIWFEILKAHDESILWLIKSNNQAEYNIKNTASNFGLDPKRLIFAHPVSHAEHLERHRHADLFLDTFNYNAHTTASDALWSGLPFITKKGEQYAARVGASLLSAINMPELIADTVESYKELIIQYSFNNDLLQSVRKKVSDNRLSSPLFDTVRYARNFERGLEIALAEKVSGGGCKDIYVSE